MPACKEAMGSSKSRAYFRAEEAHPASLVQAVALDEAGGRLRQHEAGHEDDEGGRAGHAQADAPAVVHVRLRTVSASRSQLVHKVKRRPGENIVRLGKAMLGAVERKEGALEGLATK